MSNKNYLFSVLLASILIVLISCGQSNTQKGKKQDQSLETVNKTESDSTAVMQLFEQLKTDKKFLKDLGLEHEKHFSWNDNLKKVIPGDGDGISDALLGFVIEGRGGGNNSDVHYAVFLKKEGQWIYKSQLDAQAGSPEHFYGFTEIKNGVIKGAIIDNHDDAYEVPVEFIFKNDEFLNTFTALHKTEIGEREYISVSEILTPENVSVPLVATLKDYQQLLGKGKITDPDMTVECGTYFDEGEYRELQYPNLIFELSESKKAAFKTLMFKNSGFKLQTNKGTITGKTTLKELQNILQQNDSWWINDEENGGKSISIPDSEDADNGWIIRFDKTGKIDSITLFIPC